MQLLTVTFDEFVKKTDGLKYQTKGQVQWSDELLTVKISYKNPDENKSKELSVSLANQFNKIENASADFKFAAAVAQFGLLLRNSDFKQNATFEQCLALARAGKGADNYGYRAKCIQLIENAKLLTQKDLNLNSED